MNVASQTSWTSQGPVATVAPPAELGRYELLQRLGTGGMGEVFRAVHRTLKKTVAVKLLLHHSVTPQLIERFRREIEAVGRLDHPNVVRATDAGEDYGIPFLVMDYVPGVSLHYLLQQNGPVPVAEACELVRQAALGLEYIHQQNLVHRDIKPSNLMLTPEGVVKILDLGLARWRDDGSGAEITPVGAALGTGDYLAPEQAVDSRQVDIRADIYSLGCTLFKLLCGSAPFGGERFSSFAEKVRAHREEPFPDLPEGFPADLNLVLRAMTAKDPNLRMPTPAHVAEALAPWAREAHLERLLKELNLTQAHLPLDTPVLVPGTTPRSAPTELHPLRTRMPPRAWLWGACGIGALVVAAVILWQRDRGPDQGGNDAKGAGDVKPAVQAPLEALPAARMPNLDAAKPGQEQVLLAEEPVPAWKFHAKSIQWGLDPKSGFLRVAAAVGESALLHVGEVSQPNWTLRVTIRQSTWTRGVGVYWGYRESTPNAQSDEAARFQGVRLADAVGGLVVERFTGRVQNLPGPSNQVRYPPLTSEPVAGLVGDQTLEIDVRGWELARVNLGGRDLAKFTTPAVNAHYRPEDYQGYFGTVNASAESTFHTARFVVHAPTK